MTGVRQNGFRRIIAGFTIAMLAVIGSATPAFAVDYPSWDDVQKAKRSEASKAREIDRIEGLIEQSEQRVAETQAVAEQRGAEFQVAQDNFDLADQRARALQKQAKKSMKAAKKANERAGLLAAQLYRNGGSDLSTNLFLEGDGEADDFLSKLGRVTKLTEVNDGIYTSAVTAGNTAQSLTDQAKVAKDEREELRAEAEKLMARAIEANSAAQDELASQQDLNIVLEQQLAALKDETATTVEDYEEGVEERRRAAAAAAAAGVPVDAGQLSSQGWAKPASGYITDGFGPRPGQPAGANLYHRGTDLGASCGSPIYAATGGTVVYAGWNGTYGNWVQIDHGEGISTGYAHIRPGGIFVSVGDHVDAGENIASVGTTGASTGCHLHFEVRINGTAVNAVPFMNERGVSLG